MIVLAALLSACSNRPHSGPSAAASTVVPVAASATTGASAAPAALRSAPSACADPIPVYEEGRSTRAVCPGDVAVEGLTVVDLSDAWAPSAFAEDASLGAAGREPYRDVLVALENEQLGDGPEWDRPRADRYLELYGVFPSPSVAARRLADEARHACHDAVDDAALATLHEPIDPFRPLDAQRSDKAYAHTLATRLEAERKRRGLSSIDELAHDPYLGPSYAEHARVGARIAAIQALQGHLRCEKLVSDRIEPGVLDRPTGEGLATYQREHMIVGWQLDDETRRALLEDSRELDFRTLLRSLRERVVDATGLLEDGSARGEHGKVVDRVIDSEAFTSLGVADPATNGAPDRIAEATDAAARALGWTSPAAARAFFAKLGGPDGAHALRVAMRLPKPPAYASGAMELRAEIDRGDLWYEFPFDVHGETRESPAVHHPTLTLYAKDGGREIALVRWPTTIGGWKPERLGPRRIQMVYKGSPVGPRVWRDIVVAPAWVPPASAPKRDLVRARPDGSFTPNNDVFGPGYASAYGLVMLVHHRVASIANDPDPLKDEGIRTHGSVSYDSIRAGTSHGCHRLYNHLALRIAGYLLRHRHAERKGPIVLDYARSFQWQGVPMTLRIPSRGYRYELDPPVPVEVLPGHVVGKRKKPIARAMPLPERMLGKFVQDRFED